MQNAQDLDGLTITLKDFNDMYLKYTPNDSEDEDDYGIYKINDDFTEKICIRQSHYIDDVGESYYISPETFVIDDGDPNKIDVLTEDEVFLEQI